MIELLERPARKTDKGLGYRPDLPDPRDTVFGVTHSPSKLPLQVDLEPQMPGVYDQLQLGSCTGNGIAACMQFEELMQHQPITGTPSRLYIYWHERYYEGTVDSDAGAQIRTGMKVVAKLGVPPETDWPYDPAQFKVKPPVAAEADAGRHMAVQYARLVPGVGASLRACLASAHPFVFGFSVPQELDELTPGQPVLHYPGPGTQFIGGHCVVCVGYDYSMKEFGEPMFKIRNSWGPDWADAGHFWMPARFLGDRQLSSDFWTIRKVS